MDLSKRTVIVLDKYPDLYMIVAAICLTAFTAAGKSDIPVLVIVFLRFIIPFLLVCVHKIHQPLVIKEYLKKISWLDLSRSLFVIGSQYGFFYCVKYTSLFSANVLLNTAPAFILVIYFFYDGSFSVNKLISVLLGFLGVILVLKQDSGVNPYHWSLIAGVFAGFCWAVSNFTQSLLLKKMSNEQCMFYYYFYGSVLSFLVLLFSFKISWFFSGINIENLIIIAMFSLATLGFQFFSGRAYKIKSAFELAPYLYLTVLFSWVVDFFVFKQVSSLAAIFGALLIFSGIVVSRSNKFVGNKKLNNGEKS
jgi:drug/metabolite transporter (DMT)-like permease